MLCDLPTPFMITSPCPQVEEQDPHASHSAQPQYCLSGAQKVKGSEIISKHVKGLMPFRKHVRPALRQVIEHAAFRGTSAGMTQPDHTIYINPCVTYYTYIHTSRYIPLGSISNNSTPVQSVSSEQILP